MALKYLLRLATDDIWIVAFLRWPLCYSLEILEISSELTWNRRTEIKGIHFSLRIVFLGDFLANQ